MWNKCGTKAEQKRNNIKILSVLTYQGTTRYSLTFFKLSAKLWGKMQLVSQKVNLEGPTGERTVGFLFL